VKTRWKGSPAFARDAVTMGAKAGEGQGAAQRLARFFDADGVAQQVKAADEHRPQVVQRREFRVRLGLRLRQGQRLVQQPLGLPGVAGALEEAAQGVDGQRQPPHVAQAQCEAVGLLRAALRHVQAVAVAGADRHDAQQVDQLGGRPVGPQQGQDFKPRLDQVSQPAGAIQKVSAQQPSASTAGRVGFTERRPRLAGRGQPAGQVARGARGLGLRQQVVDRVGGRVGHVLRA
jgi:hypothetical protein